MQLAAGIQQPTTRNDVCSMLQLHSRSPKERLPESSCWGIFVLSLVVLHCFSYEPGLKKMPHQQLLRPRLSPCTFACKRSPTDTGGAITGTTRQTLESLSTHRVPANRHRLLFSSFDNANCCHDASRNPSCLLLAVLRFPGLSR